MDNFQNVDMRLQVQQLFKNLKGKLPELEELLTKNSDHWNYEDPIYRFYHQSYKVYQLQHQTVAIVTALRSLCPDACLNTWFKQIFQKGTGKTFTMAVNEHWSRHTRPILEAFFHARFFLEMAVKYGKELEFPPLLLPSGWAALLYFYDLR